MKKFVCIILLVFALISPQNIVNAKDEIVINSLDVVAKNNRLFDVDIFINCSSSLAAATVEVIYDKLIDYRDISTEIYKGQIKSAAEDNKVKSIFLCEKGVDKNTNVNILSGKFKSLKSGISKMTVKIYDCVDSNGNNLECSAEETIDITIEGTEISAKKSNKKSKNDNNQNNKIKKKMTGIIGSINDKFETGDMIIIWITLFIIILVCFLVFFAIKINKLEEKLKESKEKQGDVISKSD